MRPQSDDTSPCGRQPSPCQSLTFLRDTFFEMEQSLDLFEQTIQGVYYWEYVRFSVFNELQRNLNVINVRPFEQRNLFRKAVSLVSQPFKGLTRNPFYFLEEKPLLFIGGSRRVREDDGKWWNIYVDHYLDTLPAPYYFLEKYDGMKHQLPAKAESLLYHDLLSALSFLHRAISPVKFSAQEQQQLKRIESHMQKEFGTNINLQSITQSVLDSRSSLYPLYRRLFTRVNPEVVLFVSINYQDRVAIEVCKDMGIKTVELQHGVIGPYDLGYAYPDGAGVNLFPDYLLVFGPYWRDCMRFPIDREQIIPVGFPYLEAQKRKHLGEKRRDQILFLSQPTIGHHLSRFAARLAQEKSYQPDVVYRLHPDETNWRRDYPWLKEADLTVSESHENDLYALFAQSRCQAGVYSTALFEGMAFGLPTYIVDFPGNEFMNDLVAQDLACKVSTVGDLTAGREAPDKADCSYFFQENPRWHFSRALERIRSTRSQRLSLVA